MRFQGNFKIALIAAVGAMLLAAIAGAAVFALTTLRETTEDTPAAIVGQTAGAAAGSVAAVGQAAPGSPLDPADASADYEYIVSGVSGSRDGFTVAASWDAATSVKRYKVELLKWTTSGTTVEQTATGVTATTASFKLSSVASFLDSHVVRVTPNDVTNFGPGESGVIAPPDPPAMTTSVTGTRSADGKELTVSWDAVDGADSYSLNYYVHDGNDQWFRYTDDIVGASFTMTGLQPKKAYTAAIMSVNTYREGDLLMRHGHGWVNSNLVQAPPGASRDLNHTKNMVGVQLNSINFGWTIPEFTGTGADEASDEISFNVFCRQKSSHSWTLVKSGIKPTVTGNNPTKYFVLLDDDSCIGSAVSQGAVVAINEIAGAWATHSFR